MPQFKALLSDLDGTLVNTEPLHADAWLAVLAKHDLYFDHHWFEQWIGTSDRFLAENVIEKHGLDVVVRDLQNDKQQIYHSYVAQANPIFPKLPPLLSTIQGLVPIAVATNSGRKDAEAVFTATGIPTFIQASVTADDVDQLKPAPDMYLLAAKLLDVSTTSSLVCEDSVAGLTGAKAAGCYAIAIAHGQDRAKFAAADEIVEEPHEAFMRVLELLRD
ncbi:MAG: HAD family phosphatase [Bacteroidota bacterium]